MYVYLNSYGDSTGIWSAKSRLSIDNDTRQNKEYLLHDTLLICI